jgi:anthranilate phosphoribosyltransferase
MTLAPVRALGRSAQAGGRPAPVTAPHPFAEFLRTIGRGATLGRPLDETEAEQAMGMILDGAVEPVQLGAFLPVLRYRTETPAELAGFVRAARARSVGAAAITVDFDWPSYADRHRQLPYFVLAALLLAGNGVRVLMHGIEGEGAVTTPAALRALGVPVCGSASEAADRVGACGFAYLPLRVICPELEALFQLRPLLGLRSPVNSVARAQPLPGAASDPGRVPSHLSAAAWGDGAAAWPGACGELQGRGRGTAQPGQAMPCGDRG